MVILAGFFSLDFYPNKYQETPNILKNSSYIARTKTFYHHEKNKNTTAWKFQVCFLPNAIKTINETP